MKVNESLIGIFQLMEDKNPNQEIFNFVDTELIDLYYSNMYGNRSVTTLVENLPLDDVVDIISNRYLNKWNKIVTSYLDSEDLLENYQEITKEITENNSNTTNIRTDTNKVSAYNDDDFVNKDEIHSSDDTDHSADTNKNVIRSKVKDTDFYNKVNQYLIDFDMYSIMILDINSLCTLNIMN